MESNKKRLQIITDYEDLLKQTIETYNRVYKTDFELVKYTHDTVNLAFVDFSEASANHIFQLGVNFGRASEHFDKASSQPPRSSWA
jgi:hypothetical protein